MGVFLDWLISMIVVIASARVFSLDSAVNLEVWHFVVMGSLLYLIIQLIRYKITGKVPW